MFFLSRTVVLWLLLVPSLVMGTGWQNISWQSLQYSVSETTIGLESKDSSQSQIQAIPFMALLLPHNPYSDGVFSSNRLVHDMVYVAAVFQQSIARHVFSKLKSFNFFSRQRLLALRKLRLEGG